MSAAFNVALLFYALRKKLSRLEMAGLAQDILALLGAAAVAGGIAFLLYREWDGRLGHATLPLKVGAVFAPAMAAGLLYWLVALALKVPAAKELSDGVRQRFRKGAES